MLTAADDRDQVAAAVSTAPGLPAEGRQPRGAGARRHALQGEDLVEPSLRRALLTREPSRSAPPAATLTERELQVLTG